MNITVNGTAVDTGPRPSPEVAAVRELLRQRAVARKLLSPETTDGDEVVCAIERLLDDVT